MNWELVFQLAVLVAQLAAVFTVGAFIADHIVQPIVQRREAIKWNASKR